MVVVRRLVPAEWPQAFPVMSQIRKQNEAEFLRCVRQQSHWGYELVAAFLDNKIVGVLGMRPVHTLARGSHLHVDDLVVDEKLRGKKIGHALMAYAEADARSREMIAIFLDALKDAVPFYEREKFVLHVSPSMKKALV
jgi:GNAT superfamily N-acetyltransferase